MMTAIDTNVLIDLVGRETGFTAASITALDRCRDAGALVVSPVVVAEMAAYFASPAELDGLLEQMGIGCLAFTTESLHAAGTAFVAYRRRSSKPKDRMLADFLVGAHALAQADALLTRDRGYFRTYFPKLRVVEPESG
jgi:predicted nucleic acid-binding protein